MSYNYKKVFFQRPILTQMNLFFWWFLFFTIIVMIPIVIFAIKYFTRLPEYFINQQFQKYSMNQLLQIPRSAIIHDDVVVNKIFFGDLSEDKPEKKVEHNNIIKEVEIPAVVESKPVKESPLKKYKESKKIYAKNIEKFSVESDSQVHITKPNFTDFEVPEGYRSFEETIVVGRESKLYIETCLDRFFRVQPRFRGKIIVKFDVHPDGHVIPETLKIIHSDIEYEPIKECIKKNILRWVTYPAVPKEQGIYSVTQKYLF
jgi:hypothetical protein